MNLFALLKPVTDIVTGFAERRHDRKVQERELNQALHLKKLENVAQGRIAEVEWNKSSIQKAGWRPGFLTVILSLPMILVFFPFLVPTMEAGFEALDNTPVWYRAAIAVMVSSAFGYKKFADWQMGKHYTLPDPMDKIRKEDK
jgi:hypothetical protein